MKPIVVMKNRRPRLFLLLPLLLATLMLMAQTPAATFAQGDPEGFSPISIYSLDNGLVDDSVPDASLKTADGEVFGGAVPTEDRHGNANGAMLFDGVDDYIQTNEESNFKPLTFSVWFRADDISKEHSIVDSDVSGKYGHSLIIGYDDPGKSDDTPRDGSLDVQYHNGFWDTGVKIETGVWYRAFVTYEDEMRLYLGTESDPMKLVAQQPYTTDSGFDGAMFRFGRHNSSDPQWFKGAMDDIRFYDKALAPEVIEEIPTEKPNPRGNSNGDVHISTPDGLIYDYQDTGEFLAMQSSDGKVIVQARQETWEEKAGVSINTAVALWVDGDKLEFYVKPEKAFYVNDVLTELPTTTYALPNGGKIEPAVATATSQDFTIYWPDNSFGARVIVYSRSYLDYGVATLGGEQTYSGLLGNLDGNALNDMQIQGGEQIKPPASPEDLKTFGDSWRVPAEESLFDNVAAAAEATAGQDESLALEEIDEADKADAQDACKNAGVTDDLALRNCTYDVAATGDEAFIESAQTFEEDTKDLPPSAKVPAQAGEALGGDIFNADQADTAGISILDGDDLILTTGTSADGTSYVRFNIYRNDEYVASFSVSTDADIADALAGAMAATVAPEASETPEAAQEDLATADPVQCLDGINFLNQSLQETFGEADIWGEIYAEFEAEYLPGCVGLDEFIAEAAVGTDFEALELALQEELNDWPVGSLTGGIAYLNSLVSASCSESGEIVCEDVIEVFNIYVEFATAILEGL